MPMSIESGEAVEPSPPGRAVYWLHHAATEHLRAERARVQLPAAGSAAKEAQDFLGEGVQVVSAFQNVAADLLQDEASKIDCDVLVCGNKREARDAVVKLAEAAGLKAWHAGPIDNSAAAEALTSVLIFINRNGGVDHAGIRITGGTKT